MFCAVHAVLCALAVPVAAVPGTYKRDVLGLFPGETSSTSVPHSTTHPKTFTRSSPVTRSTARVSSELSTPIVSFQSDSATPVKTSLGPTSSIPPTLTENQVTTDHSGKTWQIIGIVIIAVLFIATSITCAMYFDRLWRFLKDVICCTSYPLVAEELIPDCEKQSWDTRTLSPSPSDFGREAPSLHTIRTRELPWDTDPRHPNTLDRQLSQRNDHLPQPSPSLSLQSAGRAA